MRALPKINDLHVIPEKITKMKVCYANQVFSHSMAVAMSLMVKSAYHNVNEEALGTAKIVKFFDKLFDSVNGGTLHPPCGKVLRGGVWRNSGHVNFWKESIESLKNMYFVDVDGGKFRPPSLKNWIVTLEGFLDLYDILVGNGTCKFFLP